MPILDITLLDADDDPGLAQRLADAAGAALASPPGQTWVRLHRLAATDYAESGGARARPMLVELLLARPPDERGALCARVAEALAAAADHPVDHVHVVVAPPAAGRIAFGGRLVPADAPRRATSGARWEAQYGYSRAVRRGAHVWVTGTTSFDPRGAPVAPGDAADQARQVLRNVGHALEALDASLRDVVRTRMFVLDIDRDGDAVGRVHAEVFGDVRPATTMVEVRRLIEPWMRVEIEVDAYVAPGRA